MNKLHTLVPLLTLACLAGCGSNAKTTVSIQFDSSCEPLAFGVEEIKSSLRKAGLEYVAEGGQYQIELKPVDSSLGAQAYDIHVEEKKIHVSFGDATGGMYGALQIAEEIDFSGGIAGVSSSKGTPYIADRGFRLMPLMDARTPCYTANGDATRANFKETWDLSFWDGLFARMAKMRYNLFDIATLCAFPTMVKVPGYEQCALDDIYVYDGEYDDSYYGNGTNMFRPEHLQEGNYHVYKTMPIEEKIDHWKAVIASAHRHGILFQYDIMNIYTFSEQITSDYGIDNDRANPVTKDYLYKATCALLNTYDIDRLSVTAGENMDYPAATKMETEQWIYDVYGKACIDTLGGKKGKQDFTLCYSITEQNWPLWKDFPFQRTCSTRYADTHMYAVTAPVYSKATRDALPEGTYDTYNLRNEDAYHFTWAEPSFAHEFCRNMKQAKSTGFILGSAGYFMGKEYEFVDEKLNGGYYYDRHFINYTMFGRFSYDIGLDETWLKKKIHAHFADQDAKSVDFAYDALVEGSKWLCEFQRLFYNGGTDSAWYPETCQSHPTMGGYLSLKKFVNATNSYEGSGVLSFAEYAKEVAEGKTKFSAKTPLEVADTLDQIASHNARATKAYRDYGKGNDELNQIVLDQECVYHLTKFYAAKIRAGVELRQYNDTKDTSHQEKAIAYAEEFIQYWNTYSDAFLARFKPERFARMGIVDPSAYKSDVAAEIDTIRNWKCRKY
ncbi:MAG: hypothetical protein J6A47_01015 [Bacilli bacterium]|nr:hypothetical protein [Bacilli bacterium]